MIDLEWKSGAQSGEGEKLVAAKLAIAAIGLDGGNFAKGICERSGKIGGEGCPDETGALVEAGRFEEGAPMLGIGMIGDPRKVADRFFGFLRRTECQDGSDGGAGIEGGGSAQTGAGQENAATKDEMFAARESGLTLSQADFRHGEGDAGEAGKRGFEVFEKEGTESRGGRDGGEAEGLGESPRGTIASESGACGTATGEDDAVGRKGAAINGSHAGNGAVSGQDFHHFAAGFDLRAGFSRGIQEGCANGFGAFCFGVATTIIRFFARDADLGKPSQLCGRGEGLQSGTYEATGCTGIEGIGNLFGRSGVAQIATTATRDQDFAARIGMLFEDARVGGKCGSGESGGPASNDDGLHTLFV